MAFFGVTIETIEKVWRHPDPAVERLDLAQAKGLAFQFVVLRGQFKPGDQVVYFPIDSLLPAALVEKMGMTGKFSGKEKNRVKTIRLMLAVSQGFVIEPSKILPPEMFDKSSEDITAFLGVTKYEPPVNVVNDGILMGLPTGLSAYDIEGADRFQDVVDILLDQEVVITEKMEGTNSSTCKNSGELFVNQRNNTIVEKEGSENTHWKVARKNGLLDVVKNHSSPDLAIYNELCGPKIQDNIYKLKDHTCYIFDMKSNGEWLDDAAFNEILVTHKIEHLCAPVIFRGKLRDFLAGRSVQEASNGKSVVNPEINREGIVIKPVKEQRNSKIGRLIIKQRSPLYLAGSNN
jgi:RNA ligase (TIGR02306 family)